MPVAVSFLEAERHLSDPGLDALVLDVGLPPRPQVLVDLSRELGRDEPDLTRVARCVANDVALTAAMLKPNSPAYGGNIRQQLAHRDAGPGAEHAGTEAGGRDGHQPGHAQSAAHRRPAAHSLLGRVSQAFVGAGDAGPQPPAPRPRWCLSPSLCTTGSRPA